MPTITLNRRVFDELVGKPLSTEELKDRIPMLGTDLDELTEDEIIVEVFPDRPDMLSEQGFSRAFSSFIGVKTGLREYKVNKGKNKVIIEDSVKEVRPYTACAIVKGIKFDDEKIKEVIDIQEKLHVTFGRNRRKIAIGIYPFEKIKTPIYFKALPPDKIKFQPLESQEEMNGYEILEKHKAGIEYGHLLRGKEKFPIFIDANNKILSMPPIINSHETGKINERTKDVFIECSGFDFLSLKIALNIIVTALADMNGQVYSMDLIYGKEKEVTPNLEATKMNLSLKYINKILGLDLKEIDLKGLLEKMGLSYKNGIALIPAYRSDILHEIDLVEDIAIAYGYDKFKEEIPNVATIADENEFYKFKEKIANLIIGLGLLETSSYSLTNPINLNEKMNSNLKYIEVENPSSTEYSCLRSWLIPSLLEILSNNKHNEYPQKIFEIGKCFKENGDETGISEFTRIGILISHNKVDFTEIKQVLDTICSSLNLEYEIEESEHHSFIPGRVGRVAVKGKNVAYIGEISPEILSNWELEMPVAALELNLSEIFKLIKV